MADQLSSIAAQKSKKKAGGIKLFRDLIKRPKSANDSASQPNSTQVSVSAFGNHDSLTGHDEGSVESTASSKYIGSILVLSVTTTKPTI